MRFKKIVLLSLSFCLLLAAAGCWDMGDINKKSLVTMVLTDKKDGEYTFYVEMPNLQKGQQTSGGGGDGLQYAYVTGKGNRLSEARWDLDSKLDYVIFLGTVQALVLTEEMMKEDFTLYMARMESNVEYRKALIIFVTSDKPEDFLSVKPENNLSIGESVADTVASLEKEHMLIKYDAMEILEMLGSKTCFVLLNVGLEEGELAVTGYSIIHDGKKLDSIPFEESAGLLFLLREKAVWTTAVQLDDVLVGTKATLKKRRIKPRYEDGSLVFDVSLEFRSEVLYLSREKSLDEGSMDKIKQALQNRIHDEIQKTVELAQERGCDYLGFKNAFRLSYPDEAERFHWDSTFRTSEIRLHVTTSLEPEGMHDYTAPIQQ